MVLAQVFISSSNCFPKHLLAQILGYSLVSDCFPINIVLTPSSSVQKFHRKLLTLEFRTLQDVISVFLTVHYHQTILYIITSGDRKPSAFRRIYFAISSCLYLHSMPLLPKIDSSNGAYPKPYSNFKAQHKKAIFKKPFLIPLINWKRTLILGRTFSGLFKQ